jgi:hypothetical protein
MPTPTYPTEFPIDAIRHVVGWLRGTLPDETVQHVLHDAWVILGYALGQTAGQPPTPIGAVVRPHKALSDAGLADQLAAALPSGNGPWGATAINPLLLSLLIEVAKRLIEKWLS